MKRIQISITGIVQGVGFRPFVYNLAQRYKLGGWVLNDASGVQVEVEGDSGALDDFVASLKIEAPAQAVITDMIVMPQPARSETLFEIKPSRMSAARSTFVSPDIATCSDCRREIADPNNRRFGYAFTNCTNCGPRYSIITDVPYDRMRTTMGEFTMCPACQAEYNDPNNRRFHAQPNACPICGPSYRLLTQQARELEGDPLLAARRLINDGAILAVKGIGGYHLVCDATNDKAVSALRNRKVREEKPFAVMCGSLETVRRHCLVAEAEEQLLTGAVRPIVLLAKGTEYGLAETVAPGNAYLGVLLPYAPVHWLLFDPGDVWVMTSGNTSEEPIAYTDDDAIGRLAGIADYFLIHNRSIHCRSDDSVARIFQNKPYILRRGRGLAPAPIRMAWQGPPVLAAGGELKNTFCLTKGNTAFVSTHIGDLENMATFGAYTAAIKHYQRLFEIRPEVVACDFHPEYLSTKYAESLNLPRITVQHHHAHIASVLAEHGLNEQVIGIAFDGTGYGSDGHLWGGEFLLADCREFTRMAQCRYLPLPGGSMAIKEPWRMAAWMLNKLYGTEFVNMDIPLIPLLPDNWQFVIQAASKGINAPLTSGAGRLFDIAAALLGIRTHINYEGQAAIELEMAAAGTKGFVLPYTIMPGNIYELDFRPTFIAVVEAVMRGARQAELAAAFHTTMAVAIVDMTQRLSKITGIRKVALSGGVFQNMTLLRQVMSMLEGNFTVLLNRHVPPNDGGLALGQAAVAIERSR
ncbi:hydrogenase maturation protein HypF [Sporomusaceae bacterium BoRhaA]|uniref:carbamoyltransferase HypF n=1 Tax=Pelorhabdus rhamnosifermentans TaxID=2772457 RepID=UPI001C063A3A|nr:carbamoyltransferase HypF [Pelorhabdus rhamnosifermentans]MBU2702374.1 hydrogenase maturation protein HypF [Pelorhabdus rhamnosifermentans]